MRVQSFEGSADGSDLAAMGRVLARCADGDRYFVGRSPDSVFDLFGGPMSAYLAEARQAKFRRTLLI